MPSLREYAAMTQKAALYRAEVDALVRDSSSDDIARMLRIFYATTGLAGEAGEVCNKVKKILRDNRGVLNAETKQKLLGELGGVAWYLVALSEEIGFKIEEVLEYNLSQILDRLERNTIKGEGDDR